MKVSMLGRKWRVQYVHRTHIGGNSGLCDAPTMRKRRVLIADDLSGKDELETVLHELYHAADWYDDHDHTTALAADMAVALWRLGYRRSVEDSSQ